MTKKRLLIIICIIAAVAIYTFLIHYDLRHNGVLVNGIVLSRGHPAKSSHTTFTYSYFYGGKEKEGTSQADVTHPAEFYGKSFPVLVSTLTKKSVILVTPAHFKEFNMQYPDSLKWVLQYLE